MKYSLDIFSAPPFPVVGLSATQRPVQARILTLAALFVLAVFAAEVPMLSVAIEKSAFTRARGRCAHVLSHPFELIRGSRTE